MGLRRRAWVSGYCNTCVPFASALVVIKGFFITGLVFGSRSTSTFTSDLEGVDGAVLTDIAVLVGGHEDVIDPELSGRSENEGTAFLHVVGESRERLGEAISALGDWGGERGAQLLPEPSSP